jgi:2-amino-4-hydroxy-6-hydroxymethyldihydropteridine diphosphokinase / dihydropteroate synthase
MAKVFLGLGSNLSDRAENLEKALSGLSEVLQLRRISSIRESQALLQPNAPSNFNRPFFNIVIEAHYSGTPEELLSACAAIEEAMKRDRSIRWAPRTIDIDILEFDGVTQETDSLTIPHPECLERAFVLDPWAEVSPRYSFQGKRVIDHSRAHARHQPALMGILNVTPDSFSDSQKNLRVEQVAETLTLWDAVPLAYIDVGAESTRPGSQGVTVSEECARLTPVLDLLKDRYRNRRLRPKISVDTRNSATAALAIEKGCNIINDVTGLRDPAMIEVLQGSLVDVVLMHSLSVPPNADDVLSDDSHPMDQLLRWFEVRIEELEKKGISSSRVILDPGFGFGKHSLQSLRILKSIDALRKFSLPVMVAHSRKSFMSDFTAASPADRDAETLGVSLGLLGRSVEILRVHDPVLHHRAILAWNHSR